MNDLERMIMMRKLLTVMILGVMVMALWGCARRVSEVTAIDLNWVPQQWYQRGGDPINLGVKSVTLHYSKEPKEVNVTLLHDEVTVSGTGVKRVGDTILLNTDAVGRYNVTITAEGVSISFEYFVDDDDLIDDLNVADRNALNAIINNQSFLTQMGLDMYWDTLTSHSVWTYSVYYTRNALSDGNPNTAGEFINAYQAKQIIEESFLHGLLAGTAASDYLGNVLFPSMDANEFSLMDWNVMALNLLYLWEDGSLTYMAQPGDPAHPPYPIADLAAIYEALFYGGANMLLHPAYLPLPFGGTQYLYTKTTWPGILALGIDQEVAEFLYEQYGPGKTLPDVYQTMGFAIIGFLVNEYPEHFDIVSP